MEALTVKQLKAAIKGQNSLVVRQSQFDKSIDFFKRDNYNDKLTISRDVGFDNNQRFDWSLDPEELMVLLSLPPKAEIGFHVRNNQNERTKEAGFNSYQLMARILIRKANSDRLTASFDVLIDCETSPVNSQGSQVKAY
jgi:hypothetical protein